MKLLRYETVHQGPAFALQLSAEMFAVPVAQAPLYKRPMTWLTIVPDNTIDHDNNPNGVAVLARSCGDLEGIRFLYVPDSIGWFHDRDFFREPSDHDAPFQILKSNGIVGGRWGRTGSDGLLRLSYEGEEGMFSTCEHWATAFQDNRVIGWVDPQKNAVVTHTSAWGTLCRLM